MPQGSNAREEITGTLNNCAKGEKLFDFQSLSRWTGLSGPAWATAGP
jgi:hypothetical protein